MSTQMGAKLAGHQVPNPTAQPEVAQAPIATPAPQETDSVLSALNALAESSSADAVAKVTTDLKQLQPSQRSRFKDKVLALVQTDMVMFVPLFAAITVEGVLKYPDFRELIEGSTILKDLMARQLDPSLPDSFRMMSLEVVRRVYVQCPPGRAAVRKMLCSELYNALHSRPVRYEAILFVLNLLQPIIGGLRAPVGHEYEKLLTQHLIPLYRNEEMLNDIMCMLSMYNEPLSKCVKGILSRLSPDTHTEITLKVMHTIIGYWEKTNSKHCVAMIKAFKDLIEEMDGDVYDAVHKDLLRKLSECTGSDNAPMALEAMNLWKLDAFITLLNRHRDDAMALIVPSLVRDGKLHWNNDVNKACLFVSNIMRALGDSCEEQFHQHSIAHLVKKLKMEPGEAQVRLDDFLAKQQELDTHGTQEQQELKVLKAQRSAANPRAPLPKSVDHHLRFVFGTALGKGSYSVVKYCKRIETDVPQALWNAYAAKIISKKLIKDTNFDEQIVQEIKLLQEFDSPFISPLYAHFEDDRNIYIILEYCSSGDLFSNVFEKGPGTVPHEWARYAVAQIIMALQYIHELGYYYGDVKSENVLVTETGSLRLADFGSSKSGVQLAEINEKWKAGDGNFQADIQGTLDFLAPEIVAQQELTPAADWWALGVMLCQILYGYLPFTGSEAEIISKIQADPARVPADAGETANLVLGLLEKDPTKRFDFEACKACNFFAKVVWDTDTLYNTRLPPLTTGHRSVSSLADPRYMTRKHSMVYNAGQLVVQARQDVAVIPEETEDQLSWDSKQPQQKPPPRCTPPTTIPFPQRKQGPQTLPVTATPNNALADYVTTAPTLPPRPKKSKYAP